MDATAGLRSLQSIEKGGDSFTRGAPTCRWSAAPAASGGHQGTTNMKRTAALNRLLPASEVVFPGLFAWSPISTTALTAALNLDRGLWATWRGRRITPSPMPEAWFRRSTGSPVIYLVSDVLAWIAARHGEQFDTLSFWRLSLARDLDTETDDPAEVRKLAALYARCAGSTVGDVRFTPAGFDSYLAALAAG